MTEHETLNTALLDPVFSASSVTNNLQGEKRPTSSSPVPMASLDGEANSGEERESKQSALFSGIDTCLSELLELVRKCDPTGGDVQALKTLERLANNRLLWLLVQSRTVRLSPFCVEEPVT